MITKPLKCVNVKALVGAFNVATRRRPSTWLWNFAKVVSSSICHVSCICCVATRAQLADDRFQFIQYPGQKCACQQRQSFICSPLLPLHQPGARPANHQAALWDIRRIHSMYIRYIPDCLHTFILADFAASIIKLSWCLMLCRCSQYSLHGMINPR